MAGILRKDWVRIAGVEFDLDMKISDNYGEELNLTIKIDHIKKDLILYHSITYQ